jgi:hypothetical protein
MVLGRRNPQKLRNQLGSFWTLIDILSSDRLDKTLLNGGDDLVIRLVNQCNENRRPIELIKQTEK